MDAPPPTVEGVEHRWLELGGVSFHLAEAGPADAEPTLLLHGWPQHWLMWRPVLGGLQGQRRLIAPDLRGFGWSEAPGAGYDPRTFASDQLALLDALGLERADVVGHDWGGYTAFLLGLRHPERVRRVVALNTPHPWPRVSPRLLGELWRSWYAAALATPVIGKHAVRLGVARAVLSRGNVTTPFSGDTLGLYLERLRQPPRAAATSALYRSYMRTLARLGRGDGGDGPRLTVPTLLLFGATDRWVSAKLLPGWEAHADDMRVELVPDCGHFIVDEKPDLVLDRLREFLAG